MRCFGIVSVLVLAVGCMILPDWDRAREHYLSENPHIPVWRAEMVRTHDDWKSGITLEEWVLINEIQPDLAIEDSTGEQVWIAETTKGVLHLFVDAVGDKPGDGVIQSWKVTR